MIQIKIEKIIKELGENIKLARLRRKFSAVQVSERAGISRNTLYEIEKGNPKVSMGNYANVLSVLGLENDLELIAKDDILGRKLQDAKLIVRNRAPKRNK
jgi:transcriptional regulator with XRE-family HTH domain